MNVVAIRQMAEFQLAQGVRTSTAPAHPNDAEGLDTDEGEEEELVMRLK